MMPQTDDDFLHFSSCQFIFRTGSLHWGGTFMAYWLIPVANEINYGGLNLQLSKDQTLKLSQLENYGKGNDFGINTRGYCVIVQTGPFLIQV